jgi:WD40 repeat protein
MQRRRRLGFAILAVLLAWTGPAARAGEPPWLIGTWTERESGRILFAPEGRGMVTAGKFGHHLRDADSGRFRAILTGPDRVFEEPVFSPDGRVLYAEVSSDRYAPVPTYDLIAWDVASGEVQERFEHVAEWIGFPSFALSPDGHTLAVLDNTDRRPMQAKTGTMQVDRTSIDIAFNMSPGRPRVILWDVRRRQQIARVDGSFPLAFSPDGQTLATGDREKDGTGTRLWDAATGRLKSELEGRSPGGWPLAFSPDGRFLFSASHEDQSLWNLEDGRRWTIEARGSSHRRPAFSPDGRLLFPDGLPRISMIVPNKESDCFDLSELPPRRLDLGSGRLAVSPDARRLAAFQREGGDDTVALLELPSLREVGRFDAPRLSQASFSPDGRWLAVMAYRSDRIPPGSETQTFLEISLHDPTTGRLLATIPSPGKTWGNPGWTTSHDGTKLAISYRTGNNHHSKGDPDPSDRPMTVELWDILIP